MRAVLAYALFLAGITVAVFAPALANALYPIGAVNPFSDPFRFADRAETLRGFQIAGAALALLGVAERLAGALAICRASDPER